MIVLEARNRVGGRVLNQPRRRRRGVRARRHVRRARRRTTSSGSPKELEVGHLPDLQRGRERLLRRRRAHDLQRHRADRHRAARPGDHPRPRHDGRPARPDVDGGAGRRALGGGLGRRLGPPDARAVDRREQRQPEASGGWCPRPRGRSSAPSRASCRCCSRSSTSPRRATSATPAPSSATSTRATARRCSASRAARRCSAEDGSRTLGARVVLRSPVSRIVQGRSGVRVESKRATSCAPSARSWRSRRRSPGGSTTAPGPAGEPRPAHAADAAGHAAQGHRGLRPAVLARQGAERARPCRSNGPGERDLRRLAAGRLAGRAVRLRRRRRGAHASARSRGRTGAPRC